MALFKNAVWIAGAVAVLPSLALAAGTNVLAARQFGANHPFVLRDLPPGRFRNRLEQLSTTARQRALDKLHHFNFPEADVQSLHADDEGGIYYVDAPAAGSASGSSALGPAAAAVPVSPFPDGLKFHSRPGSTNVLVIDFDGHSVSGTGWNTSLGRDPIPAVVFSVDGDYTTYSDAEQTAIKQIWQRVAEDYAPFDIDVTTEEPAALNDRVARALVTRSTDANGQANPSSSAGGVAYIDVFGQAGFDYFSPAWIYVDNLGLSEQNVGEACSHEVGHNLGLSHDGKTDGTEYYAGHGSGSISWAPIMGVGYGQNVTQWSKGEYYLANNAEDDLAIISGWLTYRADDHSNTAAQATQLQISGGSNVFATTPETDPGNLNPANKGLIERGSDTDVFTFATAAGAINLTVRPWISPSDSRGGNLDIVARLVDAGGQQILRVDPTSQTYAVVSATVTGGIYFLYVSDTGTGNPLSSTPGGYTTYDSLGQYFITGRIVEGYGYIFPPQATLGFVTNITAGGGTGQFLYVTYSDNVGVDMTTVGSNDIRVTGPNQYDQFAHLVAVNIPTNGTPRMATYAIDAPGGTWSTNDNGTYTVMIQSGAVMDVEGASVPATTLGTFSCLIATVLYSADMSQSPGWILDSGWAYGHPTGVAGDPSSGFSGSNVVGYALNGAYPQTFATAYATTPAIDCSFMSSVNLRFQRWLGVKNGDTAVIDVSRDGSAWTRIWTAAVIIADTTWTQVVYDISSVASNQPTVYVRWGLGGNGDVRTSFGWNIDDAEVIGSGTPPTFTLSASASPTNWGSVSPTSGLFSIGFPATLTPAPAAYFRFDHWNGDLSGTGLPGVVVMSTSRTVQAVFAEIVTTNYATPYWWLAAHGQTDHFEDVVGNVGSNGMPLWQSFVAGLDPNNSNDVFEMTNNASGASGAAFAVQWTATSGHLYCVCWTPDLFTPFQPIPGATNLAWPQSSFTDTTHAAAGQGIYQVRVRLP